MQPLSKRILSHNYIQKKCTHYTTVAFFFKHVEETMIKKEGKKIHDDDDNKSFIISSHANYGAKPMIKTKKCINLTMCLTQNVHTFFFVFFSVQGWCWKLNVYNGKPVTKILFSSFPSSHLISKCVPYLRRCIIIMYSLWSLKKGT